MSPKASRALDSRMTVSAPVAVIAGLALVLAMVLLVIDLLGTSSPEAWSAAAAWTTASLALGAALVAFTQVRETRALRVEQAQPYVAVAIEPLIAVDPKFQELVIKNFGATAAFNVCLESEPPMERAVYGSALTLPTLPTLVPGQDWRVLWDFFPDREAAGLPDKHRLTVNFDDSRGVEHQLEYMLDWGINRDRLSVTMYGIHHGVKTLKEISKKLS